MRESPRKRTSADASEARRAGRSALFLSFALAGEHPCGPTGWQRIDLLPVDVLWSALLADGWRSLDDLEDELEVWPPSSCCSWCA